MNNKLQPLPPRIVNYLLSHFQEDYRMTPKSMEKIGQQMCYALDITENDRLYHLYFNREGGLVKKVVETIRTADNSLSAHPKKSHK